MNNANVRAAAKITMCTQLRDLAAAIPKPPRREPPSPRPYSITYIICGGCLSLAAARKPATSNKLLSAGSASVHEIRLLPGEQTSSAAFHAPHGHRHSGTRTGQGKHGLSTDTRRAASDDRFSPSQIDARDNFRRRRLESKVGSEPCHCPDEQFMCALPRSVRWP